MVESQALRGNVDQHFGTNDYPDFGLHGGFARSEERLAAQMLLNPFEKQLDLPELATLDCNEFGLATRVVGQKHQPHASTVFARYPAQQQVCAASPLDIWNVG